VAQVRQYIEEYQMLTQGDGVLVAISGGPDSVALAHILFLLREEYQLELHLFHLHHGMRAAADQDVHFVRELAHRWKLPLHLEYRDIPSLGGSTQVTSRKVRYQLLEEYRVTLGLTRIAVGHNADDQAETVLMRFLTGAGLKGLGGIPPVREAIIRPLLGTSRAAIESYLAAQKLEYRLDESNLEALYLRNRIRLELIPQLEREYNPRLREHLVRLARILQDEETFLQERTEELFRNLQEPSPLGEVVLKVPPFRELSPGGQRRMVLRALEELAPVRITAEHVEEIRRLVENQTGAQLHLPGGLAARLEYQRLVIGFHPGKVHLAPVELVVPGKTQWGPWQVTCRLVSRVQVNLPSGPELGQWEAFFDLDAIVPPLRLRQRCPGDCLWPRGLEGSKKVKDLLIDSKIPRHQRDFIPLLVDARGPLWLVGIRRDGRGLVTSATEKVLHVRVTGPMANRGRCPEGKEGQNHPPGRTP
jgi:tRNA(Ile)-lysidine synthase